MPDAINRQPIGFQKLRSRRKLPAVSRSVNKPLMAGAQAVLAKYLETREALPIYELIAPWDTNAASIERARGSDKEGWALMTAKGSFFNRVGAQLRELEDEIDRLEKKSRVVDDMIRKEFRSRSAEFETLVQDGESRIEALAHLTGIELERLRHNLEFTVKALKQSFDHLTRQMKERP